MVVEFPRKESGRKMDGYLAAFVNGMTVTRQAQEHGLPVECLAFTTSGNTPEEAGRKVFRRTSIRQELLEMFQFSNGAWHYVGTCDYDASKDKVNFYPPR